MKILIILENHYKELMGGAELQVHLFANYLAEEGHDVLYLSETNKKLREKKYSIKSISKFSKRYLGILNMFKIKKIMADFDPDMIYIRAKSLYLGLCHIFNKNQKVPIVYNIAIDSEVEKTKMTANKSHFLPVFMLQTLNDFIYKFGLRKSRVISQTFYQKQQLQENFLKKSIVIGNGNKLPKNSYKKTRPPTVSWVANIKKSKNPIIFVKLAKLFAGHDIRFVMVGRIASPNFKKILDRHTKIYENFDYMGELPYEEAYNLIASSDIFVNTSIDEGYPNTFIQAWLTYTPVLTLGIDPDEQIKENGLGVVCSNLKNMAYTLKDLLDDRKKLELLAKRSFEYSSKNCHIDIINLRRKEFMESLIRQV